MVLFSQVLQVIPQSIFTQLAAIINVISHKMKEVCPSNGQFEKGEILRTLRVVMHISLFITELLFLSHRQCTENVIGPFILAQEVINRP